MPLKRHIQIKFFISDAPRQLRRVSSAAQTRDTSRWICATAKPVQHPELRELS
jgi:hypothetical protein